MKLIDADALEEKLDKIPARRIENADGRAYVLIRLSTVFEIIKQMPPAQPERKKGRWIQFDKRFPWRHHYKCSECGNYLDFSGVNAGRGSANFCPNCGAKMEGETT